MAPAVDAFIGWAAWHRKHAIDLRHRPDVIIDNAENARKPGTIAAAPVRGSSSRSWSDLWSIFVPNGVTTTLAALPEDEQNRVFTEWGKSSVIAALGGWLAQSH
ncbi:hypothetical protein ACWDCB_08295 [Streptomyces sp. NPDC001178]